jgi:protein-S-isoprenylcysteine O-methyltransferase Ste14
VSPNNRYTRRRTGARPVAPNDHVTRPPALFWRAVLAFLALPAVVAYLVPWLLRPQDTHFGLAGFLTVGLGTGLLVRCVVDFYIAGHGTLAPWSPPTKLVTVGLYRTSRNPMYVAVAVVLVGFALGYDSTRLWIYAAVVVLAFHLRVVMYEEPILARTFGADWLAYRARVPRWFGRSSTPEPSQRHDASS